MIGIMVYYILEIWEFLIIGKYIMNLNPEDRLDGIDNLEVLYNTSKSSDLD